MSSAVDAALRAATVFVGREQELALLSRAPHDAGTRGVHVWGPPGVGKTRLAREWASGRGEVGVVWCDLSQSDDLAQMGAALARALDAPNPFAPGAPLSRWAEALAATGRAVVVLDGVDRLVDEALALFDAAASAAPELFWVTTARRAAATDELTSFALAPLTPDDAVALFTERATRVHHGFALDDAVRAQLDALLAALDHLPLAIEWAASRVRLLPPGELLKRLERRLSLMGDARGARLGAALEEAWADLPERAREVLSALTVFGDAFSLDAAEAILGDGALDALELLLDHALLAREDDPVFPGEVRLRLLETVRAHVRARHPPGDLDTLTARHARYYADTARAHLQSALAGRGAEHIQRVRADGANLRRAYTRSTGDEAREVGMLAHALDAFVGEHSWALDALRRDHPEDPGVALRVARWHQRRGERDAAEAAALQAEGGCAEGSALWRRARLTRAELAREAGDAGRALGWLEPWRDLEDATSRLMRAERAKALADSGQLDAAAEELEALLALPPWSEDARVASELARRVAYVCFYLGRPLEQQRAHQRGRAYAESAGHARRIAWHIQGEAEAAYMRDAWEDAVEGFERALTLHRELGNRYSEGIVSGNLGAALHRLGRFDAAEHAYLHARALHRRHDAALYLGIVDHALAALAHERGQHALALRRYAEAASHYDAHGMRDDLAATLLCRGWLRLERGGAHAREDFVRAQSLFDEEGSRDWAELATHSLARLDGRTSTPSESLDEPARTIAALLSALDAPERVEALSIERACVASLYGRLALGLARAATLGGAREAPAAPPDPDEEPDVTLGAEARWFLTPELDAPVELGRRTSIRLVLAHLVDRLARAPGEPVEVYDLFDVGWPGQEIDPELAAERVYWAVRTLRNLGMRDLLLTQDGGYLLDPKTTVRHDP
jgi:predicted ATPase